MQRYLRCYAEGQNNEWEAFCLDLDLAVQGESFTEVHDALLADIYDYVEYASSLPKPEAKRLLNRRAPFLDRWRFLWYALRLTLTSSKSTRKELNGFIVPYAS